MLIPLICNPIFPEFVSVMVWAALAVCTRWLPKLTDPGEKLGDVKPPWPVRLDVSGEPFAVTESDPVRNARAVGAKLTWIAQLLPVPNAALQLLVWVKSPLVTIEEGEMQPCVAVNVNC